MRLMANIENWKKVALERPVEKLNKNLKHMLGMEIMGNS